MGGAEVLMSKYLALSHIAYLEKVSRENVSVQGAPKGTGLIQAGPVERWATKIGV